MGMAPDATATSPVLPLRQDTAAAARCGPTRRFCSARLPCDLLTLWSDLNDSASFEVVVAPGVVRGSAISSAVRREFRFESFRDTSGLGNHHLGGLLMGFGGVAATDCSIGQGIDRLSLLSAGSCLAVAGIVTGAWLSLRLHAWRVLRETD